MEGAQRKPDGAAQLMKAVLDTARSVKAVKANMNLEETILTVDSGILTGTGRGTFQFARPNFLHLESDRFGVTVISDSDRLWIATGNSYSDTDATQANITVNIKSYPPAFIFFDQSFFENGPQYHVFYNDLGTKKIDGVACRVVRMIRSKQSDLRFTHTFSDGDQPDEFRLYISRDKLLLRAEVISLGKAVKAVSLSNVKLNGPLDKSDYVYRPPFGARRHKYEEPEE